MMPGRRRTRKQDRVHRINAERASNAAHIAERNQPPPFQRLLDMRSRDLTGAGRQTLASCNLTGLDARRADVEAVLVAARAADNVHGLDVRIPSTAGPAMGVRHRLAESGALPADIADGSHT
jgi:hypothetical protein